MTAFIHNTIIAINRYASLTLLVLLPFVFCHCVRDADDIKIDTQPRLVVGCFISPGDTVIYVTVEKSVLFGQTVSTGYNYNNPVTNAKVVLSSGSGTVGLHYDSFIDAYCTQPHQFPILAGETYSLSVQTPEGLEAKATCTVPSVADTALTIHLDTNTYNNSNTIIHTYKLWGEWTPLPGNDNYYRFLGELTNGTASSNSGLDGLYGDSMIYSNYNSIGGKIISQPLSYSEVNRYGKRIIIASLLTVDKNYYQYYQMLNRLSQDPFEEPVPTFTNIEGGLGIFAGYQKYLQRIDLK